MSHPLLKSGMSSWRFQSSLLITSLVLLDCVWPATTIVGVFAIYSHFTSADGSIIGSVDSNFPLRAEIAKPKTEERIDKFENPFRAENAKPNDSISNDMRKVKELCARIDKVEAELMDTKMSIAELALAFKDQKIDTKRLSLQIDQIFKK